MSETFVKLFGSILESTVWGQPAEVRLVWITMLAMADSRGRVYASIPGLAHRARVDVPDVERALAVFLAPDPYSRTPDYEGRRVEPIDGGWRLLNHGKYRDKRNDADRRSYQAEWVRRKRGDACLALPVDIVSTTVDTMSTHTDPDPDPNPPLPPRVRGGCRLCSGSGVVPAGEGQDRDTTVYCTCRAGTRWAKAHPQVYRKRVYTPP